MTSAQDTSVCSVPQSPTVQTQRRVKMPQETFEDAALKTSAKPLDNRLMCENGPESLE